MMMHIVTKKINIYQVFVADVYGNCSSELKVMKVIKLTLTWLRKPN